MVFTKQPNVWNLLKNNKHLSSFCIKEIEDLKQAANQSTRQAVKQATAAYSSLLAPQETPFKQMDLS